MHIAISALLMTLAKGKRLAGVGRHTMQTLDAVCRVDLGNTYEIFVRDDVELPEAWSASPWVKWHRVKAGKVWQRMWWEHIKIGFSAKKLGCELLHSMFVNIPIASPIPITSTAHDAFPRTHGDWFPRRNRMILDTMTAHACRKSKAVATVSEYSRRELAKAYAQPIEKFFVCFNGPGNDVQPMNEAEIAASGMAELNLAPGRRIFSVSTLEPRKNMEGLILAFENLKQRPGNEDVQLVIAGARGWMESTISATVEACEFKNDIQFLGYVSDSQLSAVLQTSNLFALVSHVEGFGIPVLEAMILGVPVVTSNTSSLPEVAGENAFYCDPSQVTSIADALQLGLQDKVRSVEFARLGKERSQLFTWEKSVSQLNSMFQNAKSH